MSTSATPITLASILARGAAAARLLEVVKHLPNDEAEAMLKADAERSHAEFRQYAHFWDRHRLGRATTTVKTKLGIAFKKGDVCLFIEVVVLGRRTVSAYSTRTGVDTAVEPYVIVPV